MPLRLLLLSLTLTATPPPGVTVTAELSAETMDLLVRHRLSPMLLREAAFTALCEGDPDAFPLMDKLAAVPTADRVRVVRATGELTLAWTQTPDFQNRYRTWRASSVPRRPQPPRKKAALLAEHEAERAQNRKEMEAALVGAPAEVAEEIRRKLDESQGALAAQDAAGDVEKQDQARYADELATWQDAQQAVPLDPARRVRALLEAFLTLTADVDFKARRDAEGEFEKPEYAQKGPTWRAAFAAGPEATAAARTFAQGWLARLPR